MPLTNDERDELELLRSYAIKQRGIPWHEHRARDGTVQRCTSPYCVDLTIDGIRSGPNA